MTEYNEGQAIWRVSKVTRRVLYVIGVVAAFLCFAEVQQPLRQYLLFFVLTVQGLTRYWYG